MATVRRGLDATVTSWTDNASLIGTSAAPGQYSVSQVSVMADTTPLSPSNNYATYRHGLRSWGGSFVSRLAPAIHGVVNGSVTWGTYSTTIRSWRLSFEVDTVDTTDLAATGRWVTNKPGLIRAFGVIEAYLADDAGVDVPLVGATDGSETTATLQMLSSNTLSGAMSIETVNYALSPNDEALIVLGVRATGAITAAGSSNFFSAGVVAPQADPSGDTITLTHDASNTKNVSGSAWWNRITVTVPFNDVITCEVGFVGTGALATT